MITVVVMTDGRGDYLTRSVASLDRLHGPISVRLIHDDSGDADYASWLWETFGDRYVIHSTGRRQGFAGAMRSAREWVAEHDRNRYVWWHEDDFVLTRDIDLEGMGTVLAAHPGLAQLALRRQPWNDEERAAGGVIERWPDDFAPMTTRGHDWLMHRRWFTTNPSLLPRSVITLEQWPEGANSEGRFGIDLFTRGWVSGFWGSYESGEWCEHIGNVRVGTGY